MCYKNCFFFYWDKAHLPVIPDLKVGVKENCFYKLRVPHYALIIPSGICFNKPSIIFENVGLYQLSSIHKLQTINELPQAIRKSLKKKVYPDELRKYLDAVNEHTFESPFMIIWNDFEDQFKMGGYYANVEIDSQKMINILEKFKPELTQLALIHIEKIKQLSN